MSARTKIIMLIPSDGVDLSFLGLLLFEFGEFSVAPVSDREICPLQGVQTLAGQGTVDFHLSLKYRRLEVSLRYRELESSCFSFVYRRNTQGVGNRNGDSQRTYLCPPIAGFSAFPKGPHQLDSRIPINQGRKVPVRSRSHHITPHIPRGNYSLHVSAVLPFLVHPGSVSVFTDKNQLRDGPRIDCLPIVKEKIPLRKIIGKYDFSASFEEPSPRCKGNQEAFRRGPREGAETPAFYFRKGGERRRDYSLHPYYFKEGTTHSQL